VGKIIPFKSLRGEAVKLALQATDYYILKNGKDLIHQGYVVNLPRFDIKLGPVDLPALLKELEERDNKKMTIPLPFPISSERVNICTWEVNRKEYKKLALPDGDKPE